MSFTRNPVPMNIHHLPQPSPQVATLPVDPYAASPSDEAPASPVGTEGVPAQYGTLNAANYSDKVFVVFGEATKIHKDSLKSMGGKFNGKLKPRPDTGFPGGPAWMFMFERQIQVMEFVKKVNTGTVPTQRTIPAQGSQASLPNVVVPVKNDKFQTVRWKVFVPKEGMLVTIKANGSQLSGTVIQTETHRDVVDTCYILVEETTSKLVICNGGWQVLGYMVDHTVFFKEQTVE